MVFFEEDGGSFILLRANARKGALIKLTVKVYLSCFLAVR